jgi:hypothetical protein
MLPLLEIQTEDQRVTGDWSSKALPRGAYIHNLEYSRIIACIGALRTRRKCVNIVPIRCSFG